MLAFDQSDPFADIPVTHPPVRPGGLSTAPRLGAGPRPLIQGAPRAPSPQTPGQEQGQSLQNQHTTLENQNLPITAAAQAANAARARQETQQGNTRGANYTDEHSLSQEFRSEPSVRSYETIMPAMSAAMHAGDGGAGDLQIVYAFGKAMDPNSVVRGEEQTAAANTGGMTDQIQGWITSIQNGRRLDPAVRARLINEIRTRASVAGDAYRLTRQDYSNRAQRYGFDPNAIIGQNAGLPYQQTEADYLHRPVQNMDGSQGPAPRDQVPTVQVPAPPRPDQGGGTMAFWDDPQRPHEYDPRAATAAMNAVAAQAQQLFDRGATRAQMDQFAQAHGNPPWGPDLDAAIHFRDGGGRGARIFAPQQAPERQIPQGNPDSLSESVGSNIRGATSGATAGLDHPLAAAYNTFAPSWLGGTGGTFQENLWRENAYDQANMQSHPWATLAGNLEGAAVLPTGAPRSARLAFISAIRSGATRDEALSAARSAVGTRLAGEGAVYGGIHGAATGEGDLGDRLKNAGVEAALGAATGYAGRFGPGYGRTGPRGAPQLPPLVDPVTGRLNQPLESASPGQRVGAALSQGINLPLGAATDRGGAIIEKGLDVMPASAGVMNDARRSVEGQATAALENVAGRYGSARTMDEAGTALQTGARNWISRFEQTASKAYDAIPIRPTADATLTNTRTALSGMLDVFRSNPDMRSIFQNGRLRRYLDALTPPHDPADELGTQDATGGLIRTVGRTTQQQPGSLSWQDLKQFRSIIGEEIGAERFSDSPARSQLRGLYGALSQDMRTTAAAQGPNALRTFERANSLYAAGQNRIEDALVRILGDNSRNNPEAAAAAVQTIARSGRGSANLQQLGQIRASLMKGGEWDDVAAALIRLGGQPAGGQGRGFSPQTFLNWYSDMSEPARALLFADRPGSSTSRAELRKALDGFVSVTQRLAGTNALRNTSNTTPGKLGAGAVGGVAGAAATGLVHPITALLTAGGMAGAAGANYGIAKLWTSPAFVRWATGYTKSALGRVGSASAAALASQRTRLAEIARSSPDLADSIADLDRRLFGDNSGGNGNQGH